jgi:hypothetical protein
MTRPLAASADRNAARCSFNRSSRLTRDFADYFLKVFWGSYWERLLLVPVRPVFAGPNRAGVRS